MNAALHKEDFGPGFNWGVASAAYQIEGAHNLYGKGPSIWDIFSNTNGKVYLNQNANTTCDFYHRYGHDISIMSQMGIPNFRFSLSWSRIMPYGSGTINPSGVNFYHRVIDFCLELGIEPWITLYHWDLPYALEKQGGWANRQVINWFSDYAAFCIKAFGDKVKHWMILNEPMVFTGAGYFLGIHAPGRKGLNNFLAAAHHAALCQAEGGRILRSFNSKCKIGTTFSCSYIQPCHFTHEDFLASNRVDALLNRMFVEPLAGLGYPVNDLKLLQRLEPYIKDGDESKLPFNMDFIGVQNYTREIVTHSYLTPLLWARIIKADKRNVQSTVMNWEVYPESIYQMLQKFDQYGFGELVVTENGAAFHDAVIDGEVNDDERCSYLQQYIQQVLKARQHGVNVNGYFVWSFTDNFEWAEGYRPRFGLVHVDYKTQKRTIKSSGQWYSNLISSQLPLLQPKKAV